MSEKRWATAIHEAGHAVIGRKLGLGCGRVILDPSNHEIGGAEIYDPMLGWERGYGPKKPWAEKYCVAIFAGAEAQRVILNSADDELGDNSDCTSATQSLFDNVTVPGARSWGDEAFDRYEAMLRKRTNKIVKENRKAIKAVARELLVRGELAADDVDQILAGLGDGANWPLAGC